MCVCVCVCVGSPCFFRMKSKSNEFGEQTPCLHPVSSSIACITEKQTLKWGVASNQTKVTMVGKLGSDDTASITRKHFEGLGVKCDHIWTADGAASGMAAITVSADGENCIVVVPGANLCLDASDIAAAEKEIQASR